MKIKSFAIIIVLVSLLTPLFLDAYSAIRKLNKETMEVNAFNDSDDSQEEDSSEEKEFEDFMVFFENHHQTQCNISVKNQTILFSYLSNFQNKYNPKGIDYPPEVRI
jgi:hypothetical protein